MRYFNQDSRDYEFKEKLEAGLVLTGSDAKSLRTQGVQFNGSKVEVINGIPTVLNLTIAPYKFAQYQVKDTTSERKLLLNQKEIAKLLSFRNQKYMIIPICIFTKGRWFKMELGVGRKLRKFEKRDKIKKEEMKRDLR
jgi:SsrA-binding protein